MESYQQCIEIIAFVWLKNRATLVYLKLIVVMVKWLCLVGRKRVCSKLRSTGDFWVGGPTGRTK